jgi:hypothetical protein
MLKKEIIILLFVFSSFFPLSAANNQSNFSIAPSPVAYPYFVPGAIDGRVDGSYVSIKMDQVSLKGAFFDFKARGAMNSFLAVNGELGIGMMKGSMPGIPPMVLIPTGGASGGYYYTRTDGDATLSFLEARPTLNLEIQLLDYHSFSFIVFGGIQLSYAQMTSQTKYSLIVPPPYSNAGKTYSGYTNTLEITSSMTGFQMGMQLNIPLSGEVRLSPFFMMSSLSGTATITDNPGYSGASSQSYSADIPKSTSTSFGMDIVISEISIGTVFQQIKSTEQSNGNVKVVMISAGYHFSSGDGEETGK